MAEIFVSQSGLIKWKSAPDNTGAPQDLNARLEGELTVTSSAGTTGLITTDNDTLEISTAALPTENIITAEDGEDLEITAPGKLKLKGLNWPDADGTVGQALVTDGAGNLSWGAGGGGSNAYDITLYLFDHNRIPDSFVGGFIASRALQIRSTTTSYAYAEIPPSSPTVKYVLRKDDTDVGSLTFALGDPVGIIGFISDFTMAPGERLRVVNPSTPDSEISDIMITIIAEVL